jgi:hypothetical protein
MNPDAQKMRVQRIRVRFLGLVIEDSYQIRDGTAPVRSSFLEGDGR